MQETQGKWVQSPGGEDPLEEEMTTYSSILAWKIPWTEEPGGPQSMGCKELDMTEHTTLLEYILHLNAQGQKDDIFLLSFQRQKNLRAII